MTQEVLITISALSFVIFIVTFLGMYLIIKGKAYKKFKGAAYLKFKILLFLIDFGSIITLIILMILKKT